MRKYSLFIALICIIGMLSTPHPRFSNETGVYNSFSHLYWCADRESCLHEIGHKLDQEGGWKSQTQEFRSALEIFIRVEAHMPQPDLLMGKIFQYYNFSAEEIYANLFQWADGRQENMPEIFRPFYDWERAQELLGQ